MEMQKMKIVELILITVGLIWLLLVVMTAMSKTQQIITLPQNSWEFTDQRAVNVYLAAREANLKDTIVFIRIKDKISWDCDGGKFTFSIDSIKGKSSSRQVLFSTSFISDSAFHKSTWLIPSTKDDIHSLVWWVTYQGKWSTLTIWLEKVTGSTPNQVSLIHFCLKEEPSQAWINKYLK